MAEAQNLKKSFSKNGSENTPADCTTVSDNLVANCGFETGDFTSWAFTGVDPGDNHVVTFALHSGNFGAELGSVGGLGCFSQFLATTPGQLYTLTFWLANSGRPNNFQVLWDGGEFPLLVSGDLTNMPDFDYTKYTLPGLFADGSDRIMFCARNDPSFFYLDDVVVH
jgi:hypothetical protein